MRVKIAEKSEGSKLSAGRKDREFKVSIKWAAQVSLVSLKDFVKGRQSIVPYDSIQALDVVMRQLPSMTYVNLSFTNYCE